MRVPVLDLSRQRIEIQYEVSAALKRTIQRSDFILGKELRLFEQEFAGYCNRKFCVGVNSGTDALFLALKSLGIGQRDEVIVPDFTYIATALAVTYTGAKPVFVDIEEKTYNIDTARIERAINRRTKAIIPVHLYGQAADMEPILKIAKKYKLKVIEDAAQAHGARYKGRNGYWKVAGNLGDIGCFSFYPTKNLGAFGDGGAILTDDKSTYEKLLMLRDYGRKSRYEHVSLGYNSRMDTLQAGILRVKLKRLDKWNSLRRKIAANYNDRLIGTPGLKVPFEADYAYHVYHQYVVRMKNRKKVMDYLRERGAATLIHYPIPLHLQKVYACLGYKKGDFPQAETVAQEVLSLPMYPYLKEAQVRFIAETIKKACLPAGRASRG